MRAMEIRDGGLSLCSVLIPTLKAGEILIHVAYAGVNRADLLQIQGKYAPPEGASPLPGLEVSGRIVAKSKDVRQLTVGESVTALLSGGGYAEYVAVAANQALFVPPKLALKEAACLPEAGATSIMALFDEGKLRPGERVLIHGGSSGVGIVMAQMAKRSGAEVYATVGSEQKASFVKRFGIISINHRAAPFAEQVLAQTDNEGVDVIIDTLGGPQLVNHLRLLRPGGRLVSLAMLEGSDLPAGAKMTRLLMNHLHWSGATLRVRSAAQKAELLEKLRKLVWPHLPDGSIRPVVDSVFPLAEAEKAHQRMQERLHMGKILLEVAP